MGRHLGGVSILVIVFVVGLIVSGALVALAVTTAIPVPPGGYPTGGWSPPAMNPSGAAWITSGEYLLVVDTNVNNPSNNAWKVDIQTGIPTNRGSGVREPSGVDYDPGTNTLFVSQDDGHIFVFTGFDTPSQQMITLDVSSDSFDTEDPAYNRDNGRLYWVDGDEDALFELIPVSGWGGIGVDKDVVTRFDLDQLALNADWEGLAWDPRTGNLLIGNGNTHSELIYETDTSAHLINTVDAREVPGLSKISGLGVAPASFDRAEQSLWVTDRNSDAIFELTFDGTVPPPTSSTTIQPTSTSSGGGSSSTSSTSSTTSTTVGGPTTTTTTIPGGTTTTTKPQNPPLEPDPDLVFSDMAGSVFAKSIEWLAAEGITQGCNPPANTMFCPDGRVTRGQMAAFLVRAKGLPAYNGPDRFRDDDRSVFEGAIERLAQAGITVGCNPPLNDRFCPDRNVTRGEMAAFLGRAFGYTDNGGGDWFVDDDDSVFENSIDRLRTAGITQGCNPPLNDRYCPDQFVTRGQMAAFLKRALDG